MYCGHLVPVVLLTRPLTKYLSGNYFKDRKILDLFFWNRLLNFICIKKKPAVAEKAALAREGDVTPALHCSEQAGGT